MTVWKPVKFTEKWQFRVNVYGVETFGERISADANSCSGRTSTAHVPVLKSRSICGSGIIEESALMKIRLKSTSVVERNCRNSLSVVRLRTIRMFGNVKILV